MGSRVSDPLNNPIQLLIVAGVRDHLDRDYGTFQRALITDE